MTAGAKKVDQLDGSEPRDEALALLVETEGGRLFSLGLRFGGNREEAEDLVQETFLQAWRKWDQFEGRSKASTWLYTIASRLFQRMHRPRAGEPDQVISLDELLPFGEPEVALLPEDGPLEGEALEEARRQVEQEIAALPDESRLPLVLKEVIGLPVADVAAILGLTDGTVRTRLHRARLRIRRALESSLTPREIPPPAYSKQVCLDLLQAKQEALDRGVEYEFPEGVVCERCAELFATLDLAHELCCESERGELPPELRERLTARLHD